MVRSRFAHRNWGRGPLLAGLTLVLLTGAPLAGAATAPPPASWADVDRLVAEQKYEQAATQVAALRQRARQAGDDAAWAKALIRETQLRIGLGGYATAVRFLREQPWPKDRLARAALLLYQAHAYVTYNDEYGWEIGQRERVTGSSADLEAWTREQIFGAACAAYAELWKMRETLGAEPIARLADYLDANNYPPEVRGTLRDAVAYLFIDLLGNTQGWTPAQSESVFELDLGALLKGDPARSRGVNLADGSIHPLVRIAAILDDLEAWHLGRHERDAALETRLTRTKLLFGHFTADADRERIVTDLSGRLGAFRDRPWWAMGNALLAQLEEQRGRNARAHVLAAAGAAAYPNSPGGQLCRATAARLEAPDFQLQTMEADGLNKRSLLLTHRNLASITLRAYPIDLDGRRQQGEEPADLPYGQKLRALLGTQPAKQWTVSLPATTDFKSHQTFVTPPLDKLGPYVVLGSARPDFADHDNQIVGAIFNATDLVMLSRWVDGANEIRVVDGANGNPVAGATVTAHAATYGANRWTVVATQETDREGVARFSLGPERDRSFQFVARHGGSVAFDGLPPRPWRFEQVDEPTRSLVYTDRSVYRPGQKLLFKAIVFTGRSDSARFHVLGGREVTVSLKDPNGDDVATRKLKTNAYGSVAGAFDIPAGRLLGSWQVRTSANGATGVRVEEYKRPTFEVKLLDAQVPARLNQRTQLDGEARYFFGLPVAAGQVHWRVSREPVYPVWWGWGRWGGSTSASQTVAAGTAPLAQAGHFQLAFTPRADERDAVREGRSQVSYRYRVMADVTEEAGETRSAERTFRLGFASVETTLALRTGFVRAGAAATANATRTNLDGAPRPGQASWTLAPLVKKAPLLPSEQPPSRRAPKQPDDIETPGDRLSPRWQAGVPAEQTFHALSADPPIASGSVVHDAKGEAAIALPALSPGAYRLSYETRDDFGVVCRSQKEFVVADARPALPLAVPALLALEDSAVSAGGTARVLATSGFAGQPLEWDVWRAGKRLMHRRLVAGKDAPVIEFPIRADDRGGLVVTLTAVRDHQLVTETATLDVPWDDKQLGVSLATFRDLIRPGAKETWTVAVKAPPGAKGEAARAELLAYMYDRSLDLFASHVPPDPMSLWPSRASAPALHATLDDAWGRAVVTDNWARVPNGPSLRDDRLKQDAGYAIGGPGQRGLAFGGLGIGGAGKPEFMRAPALAPAPGAIMRKAMPMANLREDRERGEPAMVGLGTAVQQPVPPPPLRTDFSETAFWRPQFLTGDGTARLQFTVPDSVTSWNVWVHAVTKDLLSGSLHRETRSVKDLMIRPSLPRFLREGDRAALKVAVNNASDKDLAGTVHLAVVDAETDRDVTAELGLKPSDLTRPFQAKKGGAATLTFALTAPRRLRALSVKATATAGALSDGELRALPILPSRVHLTQSRFVTLHDKDKRTLSFPELAAADPTRVDDQLVVTVDAQLFTTVLQALPYLITYPYECTEQTLNRFLSSAIVSSVFRDFPAVSKMAKELSARQTPNERFDAPDPNRKMALEETPWLAASRGDPLDKDGHGALSNVLDPKRADAERLSALAKLGKAQLANGAFPWFPGGAEDPYMTLYIMYGFAKAAEFKVDVPKEVVQRGWDYLGAHFRKLRDDKTMAATSDCCWEWLTFLNFAASAYPDPSWTNGALTAADRAAILAFSFEHWKEHSPYLKGLLALTLKRAGRLADAKLVWASVMDAARTTPDEGTFWAPEDRSWLWYNDTIETQAFALRTLMELDPGDARKDGLAQWLLLNKKLNQWKSTRATAEVIYALVHYLKQDRSLGVPEDVKVTVDGKTTDMAFAPDRYSGKKNQLVLPGPALGPGAATVTVEKDSRGFAFASATWQFSTEKAPAQGQGDFFSVTRTYFRRTHDGKEVVLTPLGDGAKLNVGDELEVHLSLRTKHAAEYVHLRDPRGAGFEPENAVSGYRWDLGAGYYQEIRDSGANFFFDSLPVGEYPLSYRVRASMSGTFHVGPATVQSIYAPEFNAYSAGAALTVGATP